MKLFLVVVLACLATADYFSPTNNKCADNYMCTKQMWPDVMANPSVGVCSANHNCVTGVPCATGYFCKTSDQTCQPVPTCAGHLSFDTATGTCYTACVYQQYLDKCAAGYFCNSNVSGVCTAKPACNGYQYNGAAGWVGTPGDDYVCKTSCTTGSSMQDCVFGTHACNAGVCTAIATNCAPWAAVQTAGADVGKCFGATADATHVACTSGFAQCCVVDSYTTGQNYWDGTNCVASTCKTNGYKVMSNGTCWAMCTGTGVDQTGLDHCYTDITDPMNLYGCKAGACVKGSVCATNPAGNKFACKFDYTNPWATTPTYYTTCTANGLQDDHCMQGYYCKTADTCEPVDATVVKCGGAAPAPPPGSGAAALGASIVALIAAIAAAL